MLISLLILLLLSNALTLKKDKSILFSRIVMLGLPSTSFLALNNLFIEPLEKGIGIHWGLFYVTTLTPTFNIFIFIISAVILTLTAFLPRKVYIKEHSSFYNWLVLRFSYNKNTISNKMGEQFRIKEYSLIIVLILCVLCLLVSMTNSFYMLIMWTFSMITRYLFISIFALFGIPL